MNETPAPKKSQCRNLTAFWILGLCNNFGYVVMLSAAQDILEQFNDTKRNQPSEHDRSCNMMSTGAILLADIVPSMLVKFVAPFIPFWVHARVIATVSLAAVGFLMVALAVGPWMALSGVVFISAGCGLGETTFLAYSVLFHRNVISTWSSGTGAAGVAGTLAYAGLVEIGLSNSATILIMLFVPALQSLAFWAVLTPPDVESFPPKQEEELELVGVKEKIFYAFHLTSYMIPLVSIYFLEYFINQGLFELVYFPNTFLKQSSQYRWLNAIYQIGVFLSRSSVNVISVERVWILSAFQLLNVVYFLVEVVFNVTPSIWITFAVVLWEGILGGGAYVNTFYKMAKELPKERRQFAMGVVAQSDSYGIVTAGIVAIPVHNAICALPGNF